MPRTISTNYSSGIALTDTADSPVYVSPGVSIANGSGAGLGSSAPFDWAIAIGSAASISGTAFGVSLRGAGTVVNQGAVSSSYTAGFGYNYNGGTHRIALTCSGLYVSGGGVSNGTAGVVSGLIGVGISGGSIVNAGAIDSTVAGRGAAVALAGASVTNQTGGVISGSLRGVLGSGPGSISNASGATITGAQQGIFFLNGAGSVANQGTITGGAANGVALYGGGTVGNAPGGTIAGGTYGIRIAGVAGSVTNQGGVTGTAGSGIYFGVGGSVANLTGGSIGGGLFGIKIVGGPATLTNQGSINGTTAVGVYFAAGGTVSNQSGGVIAGGTVGISMAGAAGQVINQGVVREQIQPGSSSGHAAAIRLSDGGSIYNAGGTIVGAAYAIYVVNALGSFKNAGSIGNTDTASGAAVMLASGGAISNTANGRISSATFGIHLTHGVGAVSNSGQIFSYATTRGAGMALEAGGTVTNATGAIIAGEAIGMQFDTFGVPGLIGAPGTLINAGTISGSNLSGDGMGVWLHGPGVIINNASGTIEGGTNGTIAGGPLNGFASGPFGIVAYYQTTVINYGSIGGTKYAFDAAGVTTLAANRIEIAPASTFGGIVLGAHVAAQSSLATLELMSGASAGTVAGFGSRYKYFGHVAIDPAARWVLSGTVASATTIAFDNKGTEALTFANPGAVLGTITGFTVGDTIGLAGVTVTGSSYSGGVLTLTEASGSIALAMPGTFAASDLNVVNTANGADIIFAASGPARTLSWAGIASTTFGAAANWTDVTNGPTPAAIGPNAVDTVLFNGLNGGVTGTGSVAALDVGSIGSGSLQMGLAATLAVTGTLSVGAVAGAVGQVGMSGSGTTLNVAGDAIVGDDGTGVLSVLSGATFAAASLTVGALADSSGAVVVSGPGSVLLISGALNIGTSLGTGDLTVGPGAAVHALVVSLQGQVVLEGGLLDPTVSVIDQGQTVGGFGTIAAGDIVDEGVIEAGGTQPSEKLLIVQGTVLGGGTLTVNGTALPSVSAGVLRVNAGGTLELTGPVLNAASTSWRDDLATPNTYTVGNSAIDVAFADASGVLLLDDIAGFAGTIASFHAGDAFVITGGVLSDLGVVNNSTLTFSDSGPNAGEGGIDRIIFGSAIGAAGFSIVNTNTVQVACFAKGTRIETAGGPAAVETLAVGDRVVTADKRTEPVVWLGRREIDCRRHPAPGLVWPVRIAAGAFGASVPARDLYLSPDHAVFVDGALVPVKLLVDGASISQIELPSVTYFHLELPRHEVILAEGLAVESYLAAGERMGFVAEDGVIRLFPDRDGRHRPDATAAWETHGAAPLIVAGRELAKARRAVTALRARQGAAAGGL